MPQTTPVPIAAHLDRVRKLQQAMKELGLAAVLLEPGPAMVDLSGVRWGRSERTFAMIVAQTGAPAWVLPAFEENRARELIRLGDLHLWQEDEDPFALIARLLRDRGLESGRLALEDSVRFFVFDGLRRQAPRFEYVSAATALNRLPVFP
jgi:Xaa-Pro dipeptidase